MSARLASSETCFATLMLIAGAATAVEQAGKLTDPAGSRSATPMVKYESAFADYRPFQDAPLRSWQEVNKEVADNPSMSHNMGKMNMSGKTMLGMGAMKDMPGHVMPGSDKQSGSPKGTAGGHDMGAMADTQRRAMPRDHKQAANAPKDRAGAPAHDMGAMKGADHDMGAMKGMAGKDTMAMAKPSAAHAQSSEPPSAGIVGTGTILGVDRASGKIRLTHDPIAALDWPRMTMFFRLKDGALAGQLKEGDKVEFTLEKSASGFVISALRKAPARSDMKDMK